MKHCYSEDGARYPNLTDKGSVHVYLLSLYLDMEIPQLQGLSIVSFINKMLFTIWHKKQKRYDT